jgi:SOS-response transcriptional repressor LexA
VLVRLRDTVDAETGHRYTVKRYESESVWGAGIKKTKKVILKPCNPDFTPIVLERLGDEEVDVVAEMIDVLGDLEPDHQKPLETR